MLPPFFRQLEREPSNIEDINAVDVVREKAGNAGNTDNTERKNDVHPNQVTTNDKVTGHVPRLMACAVTNFEARIKLWAFRSVRS